jgi:hypothetical protein
VKWTRGIRIAVAVRGRSTSAARGLAGSGRLAASDAFSIQDI